MRTSCLRLARTIQLTTMYSSRSEPLRLVGSGRTFIDSYPKPTRSTDYQYDGIIYLKVHSMLDRHVIKQGTMYFHAPHNHNTSNRDYDTTWSRPTSPHLHRYTDRSSGAEHVTHNHVTNRSSKPTARARWKTNRRRCIILYVIHPISTQPILSYRRIPPYSTKF